MKGFQSPVQPSKNHDWSGTCSVPVVEMSVLPARSHPYATEYCSMYPAAHHPHQAYLQHCPMESVQLWSTGRIAASLGQRISGRSRPTSKAEIPLCTSADQPSERGPEILLGNQMSRGSDVWDAIALKQIDTVSDDREDSCTREMIDLQEGQ